MARDRSGDGERCDSRAWLGPPGEGGERLSRLFGIGATARNGPQRPLWAVDPPRGAVATDPDYRLSHCEGFVVYAGEHPLGVVEGVRFESRIDRPDVLEVRGVHLRRKLILVPVQEVAEVAADAEAVILRDDIQLPGARSGGRAEAGRGGEGVAGVGGKGGGDLAIADRGVQVRGSAEPNPERPAQAEADGLPLLQRPLVHDPPCPRPEPHCQPTAAPSSGERKHPRPPGGWLGRDGRAGGDVWARLRLRRR